MNARKQLLAAGSTLTLVAGGVFLSAAPASAVQNSTTCLAVQDQFTQALHNVELSADLEVELAVALQNLVDAQETLDLLNAEGTLTLSEIEAQIALLLEGTRLNVPNLPNIQALLNANASAGSAVGQARAIIDVAVDGPLEISTLEALAAAGVDPELFLLAPLLDEVLLNAAVTAALDGELPTGVNQDQVDALLADINDGNEVLGAGSVTTLSALGIDVADFETRQYNLVAIRTALEGVVTVEEQEAALALIAALNTGDLAAILAAEAALEALVGENVDLTALANLQTQFLAAQAVLNAQADLDAAIAVVNALRAQLAALDIDLPELETLFNRAIEACAGVSGSNDDGGTGGLGGHNDGDAGGADGAGADSGAGAAGNAVTAGSAVTAGGAVTTRGGTNRGMNVQTAASAVGTDAAGIGALAAGIGFMVAAGTLAARRIRTS